MKLHYRKTHPAEFSCLLSYPKTSTDVGRGEEDLCWCGSRNLSVLPQPEWQGEHMSGCELTDRHQRHFHRWWPLMCAGTEGRWEEALRGTGSPACPEWDPGCQRAAEVVVCQAALSRMCQPNLLLHCREEEELSFSWNWLSPFRVHLYLSHPCTDGRKWRDTTSLLPLSSARCLKCHLPAACRRQVGWQLQADIYECLDYFIPQDKHGFLKMFYPTE